MKKLIVVFSIFIVSMANAQEAFLRKDLLINAGLNLIRYGNKSYPNSDAALKSLPVNFSVEYGVTNYWSVGVFAGYYSRQYRYLDSIPGEEKGRVFKSRYIPFGVKGTFHFTKWLQKKWDTDLNSEKVDIYSSVLLGYKYNFLSNADNTGVKSKSTPTAGLVVGIRYFFNYRFGMYAEVGPSIFGIVGAGFSARF